MKGRFLSLGPVAVMTMSSTTCGGSDAAETTKAAETTATDAKAKGNKTADTAAADAGAAGDVFKIDDIGPITGGAAVYGVAIQHGAELVVKEINEAGGINDTQIEFNFQDDEHDAEEPVDAYNTLKDQGIQVLMNAAIPVPCIAVADKTAANNVFQITPPGSAIECATNPNIFRICFSHLGQGTTSAKYISENKLASKIAVICGNSNIYSSNIHGKPAEESANRSIKIVAAKVLTAGGNKDSSVQLQKVKDAGAELVFLLIYYTEASPTLQQASTTGFVPQFFGCDGIDGILQAQNLDTKLVEGLMPLTLFAADATDDLTVKSVESYKAAHNEVPVQFAADAYDTTCAIKAATEDASITLDADASMTCDALKASMPNIKLDGPTDEGMIWTEDGEPHKAPKAVEVMDEAYSAM